MVKTFILNIGNKDALIIADIQNDFLPGGALAIKEADQVIPVLNEYIRIFNQAEACIIASRDWHPANHISFKDQGGPWPPHCIQESEGAQFNYGLKLPKNTHLISKATDADKEAYSVFDKTGLADTLEAKGITRVFVSGLTTDYCVVSSVLDAVKLGLNTIVLVDAIRGINVVAGDVDRAIAEMTKSGAGQVTLEDFTEVAFFPESSTDEIIADRPLNKIEIKKKARMRPKGAYKQVRRERG